MVNYAELNDVYLPPLGPKDFVASGNHPSHDESTVSSVQSLATRASRRLHGMCRQSEQSTVNRWEVREDPVDDTPALAHVSSRTNGAIVELGGNREVNSIASNTTTDQYTLSSFASNTAANSAVTHASWEQRQTARDDIMPTTTTTVSDNRVPVWNGLWTD